MPWHCETSVDEVEDSFAQGHDLVLVNSLLQDLFESKYISTKCVA